MKRKINLNFLPISIDEDIIFPDIFLANTDIVRLEDIYAKGDIFYNCRMKLKQEFTLQVK